MRVFLQCRWWWLFLLGFCGLSWVALATSFGEDAAVSLSWKVSTGDSALKMGFPSIAESFYAEALAESSLSDEESQKLRLKQVTALIAKGDTRGAANVLVALRGMRTSEYFLRAAIVASMEGKLARVKDYLNNCNPEELSRQDAFWYYLLQGDVAAHAGQSEEASFAWGEAEEYVFARAHKAALVAMRSRFELEQEKVPLNGWVDRLKSDVLKYQDTALGPELVKQYAIAMNALGKRDEAMTLIEQQLAVLNKTQENERAVLLFLFGLLAGPISAEGQQSFESLFAMPGQQDFQRMALYSLAGQQEGSEDPQAFKVVLDALLNSSEEHPFKGELILLRAHLALRQSHWEDATRDAQQFVDHYSNAPLKDEAYLILAYAAWNRQPPQYRVAADYLSEARKLAHGSQERDKLGVLVADCYFLNKDYKKAVNAYRALLDQKELGVSRGVVLYQWVLANIRLGNWKEVQEYLNEPKHVLGVDSLYRWKIEWNLIYAMRAAHREELAFERIGLLLENATSQGLDAAFRFRLLLLEAELSFDVGHINKTPFLVDNLLMLLEKSSEDSLSKSDRYEIFSRAWLLKGHALIKTGKDDLGLEAFKVLRREYPSSRAAEQSYLVEARFYASMDKRVDAQQRLIEFVDVYPASEDAPIALYEAALNAEARGLESTYENALNILERLVKNYSDSPLVYDARMQQADLLRKMNEFGVAQLIYENLAYQYPNHPQRYRAMLSRADCLSANASKGMLDWSEASDAYERLYDLSQVPDALHVQAGYKWGFALEKDQKIKEAQVVYWSLLERYLLNVNASSGDQQNGHIWLSRSLFALAQLSERNGDIGEAIKSYQMILDYRLPGQPLAKAKKDTLTPFPTSELN